jgi:hypothetical protein
VGPDLTAAGLVDPADLTEPAQALPDHRRPSTI